MTTRMYNEKVQASGRGALYRGPVDCLVQTVRAEGVGGLLKGVVAHFMRIGPHTVLTFAFFESLKKIFSKH
jgi:solute carrier family 25 protein 34/35